MFRGRDANLLQENVREFFGWFERSRFDPPQRNFSTTSPVCQSLAG